MEFEVFVAAGVVVAVMAETRRKPLFAPPLFVVMPFVLEITKKRHLTTRLYKLYGKVTKHLPKNLIKYLFIL